MLRIFVAKREKKRRINTLNQIKNKEIPGWRCDPIGWWQVPQWLIFEGSRLARIPPTCRFKSATVNEQAQPVSLHIVGIQKSNEWLLCRIPKTKNLDLCKIWSLKNFLPNSLPAVLLRHSKNMLAKSGGESINLTLKSFLRKATSSVLAGRGLFLLFLVYSLLQTEDIP